MKDVIILIHGLMRSKRSMLSLQNFLEKQGYEVFNYNYRSTKFGIHAHSLDFLKFLTDFLQSNPVKKITIITHSLGGVIAREALCLLPPSELTKFDALIMLAPPNRGSLMAKIFAPIFGNYIKPLSELSSDEDAYVHQVSIPAIKIGIIAGRFDLKTPVSVTQLTQASDMILINAAHTFIMNNPAARKAILNFLQQGKFKI